MKRITIITILLMALGSIACQKDPIPTYAPEDSAVVFKGTTNTFSFKGMTEDYRDLDILVELIGYCAGYDREFEVEVEDDTAVLGRDFTILSSVIKAGAVRGSVRLRVNHLPAGVERQDMKLHIVPNEFFRAGPPARQVADVTWSEEYTRPGPDVWRGWYLFFCHGYSKEYHRLMVAYFGESIEHVVTQRAPTTLDPTLSYKLPTWWYTSTREFRDWVRKHDLEHPDEVYRHSDDYEEYMNQLVPHGDGTKPETIPTIFETLNVL